MAQGQGLTPEQAGILLGAASSKLGKDPAQLRQELTAGSWDGVLSAIGADREKLRTMLENRAEMEELMRSDRAQGILRELLGGKR